MKLAQVTRKDGSIVMQVVIEFEGGTAVETLSIGEWSKLIANPIPAEEHGVPTVAPYQILI